MVYYFQIHRSKVRKVCLQDLCKAIILYVSELFCTKETKSIVGAMCGGHLKDRNGAMVLMLMFGLNETIDHLAMVNGVFWYGHVLRREVGHWLRSIEFEVKDKRQKGRPKRTWKREVVEERKKVCMSREVAKCRSKLADCD